MKLGGRFGMTGNQFFQLSLFLPFNKLREFRNEPLSKNKQGRGNLYRQIIRDMR
jgi:hypothetical protein